MRAFSRLALAATALLCTSVAYAEPSIEIVNSQRKLYLHDGNTTRAYNIAVGTPDEQWVGSFPVTRKAHWPDWRPTASARAKHPNLKPLVKGGPGNPLGARALYLGSSVYRIHGTNEPNSIGKASSSGCFRMRNEDVVDLYERVPVGTVVTVR